MSNPIADMEQQVWELYEKNRDEVPFDSEKWALKFGFMHGMAYGQTLQGDFILNAVKGYLRTCQCGGMTKKQADLVLACIEDMVRLDYFLPIVPQGDDNENV